MNWLLIYNLKSKKTIVRELFKEIYNKEGGVLDITRDTQLSGRGLGARDNQETYHLAFLYNDTTITLDCGLGLQSVARISCVLPRNSDLNNFEIDTKSHISLLFSSNKNRLTIDAQNHILSKFIEHNSSFSELNEISKRTKFQPLVMGSNKNKSYSIVTEYHLFFNERNETFPPLIQFYKDLIDYLN